MKENEVLNKFSQGFDCSQVVFEAFADSIGIDRDKALKIAACFGGGMWYGHECGAVTGALMVIGARYGHCRASDDAAKNQALEKMREFRQEFTEKWGSCVCRDILGYDLSNARDMEKIQQEALLTTRCPKVVCDSIAILEKLL